VVFDVIQNAHLVFGVTVRIEARVQTGGDVVVHGSEIKGLFYVDIVYREMDLGADGVIWVGNHQPLGGGRGESRAAAPHRVGQGRRSGESGLGFTQKAGQLSRGTRGRAVEDAIKGNLA